MARRLKRKKSISSSKAREDLELFIQSRKLQGVKKIKHTIAIPDYRLKPWERGHGISKTSDMSNCLPCTLDDPSERIALSRQYPIAPAYNKGAYQVISKTDIQTAGKKV